MAAASPERVRAVVAPVVAAAGLDLEDLSVTSAGRRRLLRVAVDRDGGVGLEDISLVSQRISAVLDGGDVMGEQPYMLEVGSPGVDRPLTQPRHWRRATGRLVSVTLADGAVVVGRVLAADAESAELATDAGQRRLALADVARARVEVEFGPPATDGPAADDPSADAGDDAGREG